MPTKLNMYTNSSALSLPSQVGSQFFPPTTRKGNGATSHRLSLGVHAPHSSMVSSDKSVVAQRLTMLFERYRQPNGKKWTYRQVADWINETFGQGKEIISASYVFQLKTGARPNPSQKVLEWVAAFFKVDPALLITQHLDEVSLPDADEVVIRQALTDSGLRHAMLLLAGVRRDKLPAVISVLELASETLSEHRKERAQATSRQSGPSDTESPGESKNGSSAQHLQ
jgi:hypothetical protein